MSTIFTRVRGSAIAGSALFCVVEGTRLALSWPVPCEMMLERARTDAEIVGILGGAPVRLSHPFWKGDVSDKRAVITLPLRGAGAARATLEGTAECASGAWRLQEARVRVQSADGAAASAPVEIDLLDASRRRPPPVA
jgi:hypothetical protein